MLHKPVRVFLIRKKVALAIGALLAAAAIFCAVNVPAAITAVAAARQLPIYSVDRSSEDGKNTAPYPLTPRGVMEKCGSSPAA